MLQYIKKHCGPRRLFVKMDEASFKYRSQLIKHGIQKQQWKIVASQTCEISCYLFVDIDTINIYFFEWNWFNHHSRHQLKVFVVVVGVSALLAFFALSMISHHPPLSPASGRLARFSWPSHRRCFAFLYKVVKTVSPASSSKVSGCRRSCPSRRTRRETDRECQTASIFVVRPRPSDKWPSASKTHEPVCFCLCVWFFQLLAPNYRNQSAVSDWIVLCYMCSTCALSIY